MKAKNKKSGIEGISNTWENLKFQPWKKYIVTPENREKFPALKDVDYVITVLTKNEKNVLACFVTIKKEKN